MGRKIGIAEATAEDVTLISDLLHLMTENQADFTNTFRALLDGTARDEFTNPSDFDIWERQWHARMAQEVAPDEVMATTNPVLIPRNHRIEEMIAAAVSGDTSLFERLMSALASPYVADPAYTDLRRPPTEREIVPATFCGT